MTTAHPLPRRLASADHRHERTNDTAGARRIAAAFARARADGRAALIPYIVAGYPDAEASFEIALAAADAGADLLEVGLPYSDPLADGATLQRASGVALAAGATLEGSLRLIERIGAARPDLPLVPMGYANQVIGGGDGEAVARRLAGAGAAGLIVADLTPDEGAPFEAVARAAGLAVVYLVAPTTSPARRAAIAARSGGFLYCVSLVGVTGARTSLPASVGALVRDVKAARRSRSPSGSGSAARPMSGRSRGPVRTASSSPRRSSTRSARTVATSPASRGSSGSCARPPESMGHHGHMATFDERAKDWDTPERIARAGEAADAIRANVPLASTDRVVDIGAGTGLLGLALLDDIGELVLAEPSDGMLAVIGEKLTAADLPQVSAIKLDLVADPPPSQPFDLAVSFLVLHHIEDTAAALAAIRRMLVQGGRLALSDLDSEDGTFHSAEAEGIHHLGFDRDGLVGAGPQRRLRRRRGALGDRHRGRGSPLPGLPAARPEPLTARRGPGILGPCTRIASRSPRRSAASGPSSGSSTGRAGVAPARTSRSPSTR